MTYVIDILPFFLGCFQGPLPDSMKNDSERAGIRKSDGLSGVSTNHPFGASTRKLGLMNPTER